MTFLASLPAYGPARDAFLLDRIAAGQIDPPTWVRVRIADLELEVSADYLSIAGDRVPMSAPVAQAAVDALDAFLPTPALVDAIEHEAALVPLPTWSPAPGQDRAAQISSAVLSLCEQRTRVAFEARGIQAGQLVAGHRKDVVLAAKMPAGYVAIYGARWSNGLRLQPLYTGHEAAYADYSHGVRAVRRRCRIGGEEAVLDDVYQRAPLGPVASLRYAPEGSLSPEKPSSPSASVLRQGDGGPAVVELQRLLTAAGLPVADDGFFGPLTRAAVIRFQAHDGLQQDGLAGPNTLGRLRARGEASPGSGPVYPAAVARALGFRAPLAEAEVDRVFGRLPWSPIPGDDSAIDVPSAWRSEHLTVVTIPELVGILGAPTSGKVQIARAVADQLCALWAAWKAKGKLPLVKSYAGSVAFRRVRGGVLPSRHARGLAFDINVAWNPMGTPGAPRGAAGSVCDLLEDLPAHGFTSGGLYTRPDWMHVEALEALS